MPPTRWLESASFRVLWIPSAAAAFELLFPKAVVVVLARVALTDVARLVSPILLLLSYLPYPYSPISS